MTFREVLDFEDAAAELRLSPALKTRWIWDDFGVSRTRYHQFLVNVIELPEALKYAPALVCRLRRLAAEHRRVRTLSPRAVLASDSRQRRLAV